MTLPIKISAPAPSLTLRRVRKWGDPVMLAYGFDVNQVGTTNFQAVRSYNKETGFGAVSNFLRIPHDEVMNLREMQFAETTDRGYFDEKSKMNWLCAYRGKIYMYDADPEREPNNPESSWETASFIRWGTLTLGGNLVQVERYETIRTIFGTNDNKYLQDVPMARLVGFRPSDWARPLNDLIAEGLVHYCYCAYKNNQFGHSPKGVCYSPFFDPGYKKLNDKGEWVFHYDFSGSKQPDALYTPVAWLEPEE